MNTDTGRIYDPEQYEALKRATGYAEGEIDVKFKKLVRAEAEEFRVAMEAGKVVPVSDRVAELMQAAQRAEKHKAKRKAASLSRKKNRHGRKR